MKALLPLILLVFLSCQKEPVFDIQGTWSLDRLESHEDYYLPALQFNTDTVFDQANMIFDSSGVYTLVDGSVSPIEIIGYHYQSSWAFTYSDLDSCLWIGVEPWTFITKNNEQMVLQNETNYGLVGLQVRTLYLSRK